MDEGDGPPNSWHIEAPSTGWSVIETADNIDARTREILRGPNFWTLSTTSRDGAPQASVVWADYRAGRILVNSVVGRVKTRNIEREKRIALTWVDPEDGFNFIAIRGRVVKEYTGEQAESDIDELCKKYTGTAVRPMRHLQETRISYLIEPMTIAQRVRR
jgi:PPOX class probable F420-dependent enzyme